MDKQSVHNTVYNYTVPLILFLVPFNFVISNVLILLISANWLIEFDFKNKFSRILKSPYILFCLALFILICIELFFTHNVRSGIFSIEKKLSLLCFPLVIGTSVFFKEQQIKIRSYLFFYYGTLTAAVILIVIAFVNYFHLHDSSVFFYHDLVAPYKQHAVYFSVYIYVSLLFIYYNYYLLNRMKISHVLSILFLSCFLILLSSKLILIMFLAHAMFLVLKKLSGYKKNTYTYFILLIVISVGSLIFLTKNPIKERFNDLSKGNVELLTQVDYNSNQYFNAWQLRLLLWKFSGEILTEKHKWLIGVTPGDAQDLLNQKIKDRGMYTGAPEKGDLGYLNHNCHNQYVETLFQTGIIGLLLLLCIVIISIKKAWKEKDMTSFFVILLFAYFFITESPLERMMGIIPLFIFLSIINLPHETKQS